MKFKRSIIYVIIGLFVLSVLLFSEYGYLKDLKLKKHNGKLSDEIQIQLKLKDSLTKRIRQVIYDTNEIEQTARFNYGMIKANERVFVIRKSK